MNSRLFSLLAFFAIIASALSAATPAVDFDRQVRPILSDNCFTCHGPDEKRRMAGLHFDTKEGAFSKAGVIVPGDSSKSRMYFRVSNPNEAMRMPPPSTGHKLTPQQVETIKNWIDSGAKWETHWAFVPPKQPDLPTVQDEKWARNPIDKFVLAKLEKDGLHPAPEADRATLLRRVTFDLTGIPPTPAELKSFLEDKSPNAYEKVVDRLIASPHYGERMAMQWLDFARYADTHGYHIDSARDMWLWRDWVIKAFNNNMPYDQFTVDQLAGDLLPNPTKDQLIATGFNRNHMINFEGGAIPEEYQTEYVIDRLEATSTTFLGITLGCARCHNHKYDPFTQKDFYSFAAFFNNVPEKGLDGYTGNAVPFLQMPDAQQTSIKDTLLKAIKAKDSDIKSAEGAWEQREREMPVVDVTSGLTDEYAFDNSLSNSLHPDTTATIVKGDLTYSDGRVGRAADFEKEPHLSFGNTGAFSRDKAFTVAVWVLPGGPSGMQILQRYGKSPKEGAGYEIALDYCGKTGCDVIVRMQNAGPESGIEVKSKEGVKLSEWNHVAVSYDGSARAKGVEIFINGHAVPATVVRDTLASDFAVQGDLQTGNKDWGTAFKGKLGDLRIYNRRVYPSEAYQLGRLNPVHSILQIARDRRTEDQTKWVREYFLSEVGNSTEKQLNTDFTALNKGLDEINKEIPSAMVMSEMEKPRDTFILLRGDYRNHGDKVDPNVPAVLPPLPKDAPRNRLTLAKWLIDPGNPLTARVAVNHFWQMYFGLGIVKTSEDFGSQGDPPADQPLLDWLATEFIRTKWDVKAMQRLIVTSAAYRQNSKTIPDLLEKDPENRLLAHGPRFRLPAEMIRDNALFLAGLMNDKIGGPSVLPYQPKGLWEEMAFGGNFSAQTYVQSHGSDLYRRSMYTFWKRTVPPPELNTFDAPDREKCTARRTTTNTPLQALVLLNDPTYIEAARAFAERDLKSAGPNETDRIKYAFRLATDRDPSPQEINILDGLYKKQYAHYSTDKAAADKLLSIGESKRDPKLDASELAAWTLVTSTILNMDESVTKN